VSLYFDVYQNKEPSMNDAVFRAIADPQRRKILKLLQGGSMTAGEIADAFEITKGSLSYHFNILKEAELIRCQRRAQEQVYSLNTSVFEDVASMLLDLFQKPIAYRKRV
jgi:ArsR family transcriptional regulator